MLAAATRVARMLEAGDTSPAADAFARSGVVIVENFAPFVFDGPGAVERWASGMAAHLAGLTGLRHEFSPAQDFRMAGELAYFSLPTTWRGATGGRAFTETGGWSFVLAREAGDWRVRAYGWAVTGFAFE
jgi:hypothetical protein